MIYEYKKNTLSSLKTHFNCCVCHECVELMPITNNSTEHTTKKIHLRLNLFQHSPKKYNHLFMNTSYMLHTSDLRPFL